MDSVWRGRGAALFRLLCVPAFYLGHKFLLVFRAAFVSQGDRTIGGQKSGVVSTAARYVKEGVMELDAVADFKGVPVGGIFVLPCFDKPEQVEREIHGKAQGLDPQVAEKKTMREMSRPKMGMMRKMRSIKTMAR